MHFCALHRISRWPLKVVGKQLLRKVASRLCIYPVGQKFRWNCSISHCFWDKCTFAFYAEIQEGHQKWRESDFCLKLPVDSPYTLRTKNLVEIALSHTVSKISVLTFHAEIQDGRQKWRETDFCEKVPLSRTAKEIGAKFVFFHFGRKFKMAIIFRERKIFWKLERTDCLDNLWVESFVS